MFHNLTDFNQLDTLADSLEESAVLFISNRNQFTEDEHAELCDRLISMGGRYFVCFGLDGSYWDDLFDLAYLKRNNYEVSEHNFVMTTWHDKEPLEETLNFFINGTNFDDWTPSRYIIIVLGEIGEYGTMIEELARNE